MSTLLRVSRSSVEGENLKPSEIEMLMVPVVVFFHAVAPVSGIDYLFYRSLISRIAQREELLQCYI